MTNINNNYSMAITKLIRDLTYKQIKLLYPKHTYNYPTRIGNYISGVWIRGNFSKGSIVSRKLWFEGVSEEYIIQTIKKRLPLL